MFKRNLCLSTVLVSGILLGAFSAQAIETKARNLILMDYDTGQYLYNKEIDKRIPPASMSKLMTVYMLFEKLKDGTLSLGRYVYGKRKRLAQRRRASGGLDNVFGYWR